MCGRLWYSDHLRVRQPHAVCFRVTVPVVLLNTVVLSLGVFHILYGWLIAVLFYGTLLLGLLRWHSVRREQIKKISRLFLGTYGIRLLLLRLRNRVKDGIGHVHAQFRQSIRGRRCVYLMLGVVVCFGMVYFSYGAFHDYSYGFGDMYRHHSWIYGLLNGTPFYEGIYPEAMHRFYLRMRLFGVKIYSSQLFRRNPRRGFSGQRVSAAEGIICMGWNRGACTGVVPDRGSFVH